MKVYVLVSFDYEDHAVEGVFTTREKAEAAKTIWEVRNIMFNSSEIVEHELDPVAYMPPPGLESYCVCMYKSGKVEIIFPSQIRGPQSTSEDRPFKKPNDSEGGYSFSVWAKDGGEAAKIANERRLELINTNTWIDIKR